MSFKQYSDVVLSNKANEPVQDLDGNLFDGTAKLYLAMDSEDFSKVLPVDVLVSAGLWSYKYYADTKGLLCGEIRAEGATHGSSGIRKWIIEPSPFPGPI